MYHYPAEFLRIIFFLALVVVVTACSGGGNGSDADTPATTNSTLLFASLTDISVAENSITTGYVAAEHSVSGANGNTITFNLSGGADQAEFTINSNSLMPHQTLKLPPITIAITVTWWKLPPATAAIQ